MLLCLVLGVAGCSDQALRGKGKADAHRLLALVDGGELASDGSVAPAPVPPDPTPEPAPNPPAVDSGVKPKADSAKPPPQKDSGTPKPTPDTGGSGGLTLTAQEQDLRIRCIDPVFRG